MSHEYFICHLAASQIYLMTPWTAGKPLILKDYTACYAIYYEKEKKTKNTTITLMTAWARLHESTLSSVGCYGWHNRATSIYDMMCSSFWKDIFRVNVKSSFRQLILFFPSYFRWNGEIVRSPAQTGVTAWNLSRRSHESLFISSMKTRCSASHSCKWAFFVLKPNLQVGWRRCCNRISILVKPIKCSLLLM